MAGAIEATAVELAQLLSPLRRSLVSANELAQFLRRFGIDLDGQLDGATTTLAGLRDGALALTEAAENARTNGFQIDDVVALFQAAKPIFDGISGIGSTFATLVPAGMTPQQFADSLSALPEEMFDLLLSDYLVRNVPLALHVLGLLDVLQWEAVPASGDPRSRGVPYIRYRYEWSRVGLAFSDPAAWARASYNWGVDFDSSKFLQRFQRIFEYLGGMARLDEMTPAQMAAFLPFEPPEAPPPTIAMMPLQRRAVMIDDDTVDTTLSGEIGLAAFPVSGKTVATADTDKGLALGPYFFGAGSLDFDLGSGVTARLTGNVGGVGGVIFAVRPSGAEVKTGIDEAAYSGSFAMELSKAPTDGATTMVLIGKPQSSRIQTDKITVSFGGEATNVGSDIFAAAGLSQLKLVVDLRDDGFLGALVPQPFDITIGNLVVGWRPGRGLYFESGAALAITVPLNLKVGPVGIYEIKATLDMSAGLALSLAITGDARLGPLYAYVENTGLTATLRKAPGGDGNLGGNDLSFGFKPPTGYAIALKAAAVEGGGFLSIVEDEYRGALALKFTTLGFSAFGILNTKLPDGKAGFSFAASLFGEFTIPLGYGFFLTGVGGVIGINRTIDTDALRAVLFDGRLDNLLFPADPIQNAKTILDDMAAILPAREGQHVFGPVARIAWGQPVLLEVKLGVVIEVGAQVRLLVLGVLSSSLPTREAALVVLSISFFGEIDFAAGTISFDATLVGSRVLSFPISGDAAIRTGWAPRLDHVAAFGGLHPRYPRPANLPELRRLSINFGSNNPKVTLSGYAAATLGSLQFGARADLYAKGPKVFLVGRLAAEGWIYFDALIYFNPFRFTVNLGGGLQLLVDGDVEAGLGFDLTLTGPNTFVIDGKVWVTVFGVDVDFSIKHTWGSKKSLPTETVEAKTVLLEALRAARGFEPVPSNGRSTGVGFSKGNPDEVLIDPVGGVRVVQRAVPLGVTLEKIGEADVAGPALLDLKVFSAGGPEVHPTDAPLDFVRGHFFKQSEAERLRAPAFEQHKAGFEVSGEALTGATQAAIVETYGYEVIHIPVQDDRAETPTVTPSPALGQAFAGRWMGAHFLRTARPPEGFRREVVAREPVRIVDPAYVVPADGGLAGAVRQATFTKAQGRQRELSRGGTILDSNPVVIDYVAALGR